MAGWLGFYAHAADAALLHQRLNEDPEIAFLLPAGPGCWRAVWRVDDPLGRTKLWHVPGGPLPLLGRNAREADTFIEDPFAGWQERREGHDPSVPYFGPSWPCTLELKLVTPGWRGLPADLMPMSGLGWFGRLSRKPSPPETRKWWRRFQEWMRRHAVRVTRMGALEAPGADIWALPEALRALRAGMERDEHPLPLHSPPRPGRLSAPGD
jgi:hypothetical protein